MSGCSSTRRPRITRDLPPQELLVLDHGQNHVKRRRIASLDGRAVGPSTSSETPQPAARAITTANTQRIISPSYLWLSPYHRLMDEYEILAELNRVTGQLAALPADAFAERYPLVERQAELRELLAAAQVKAGRDAADAWADQASRKQSDEPKPFIEIHLPDSSASGA